MHVHFVHRCRRMLLGVHFGKNVWRKYLPYGNIDHNSCFCRVQLRIFLQFHKRVFLNKFLFRLYIWKKAKAKQKIEIIFEWYILKPCKNFLFNYGKSQISKVDSQHFKMPERRFFDVCMQFSVPITYNQKEILLSMTIISSNYTFYNRC